LGGLSLTRYLTGKAASREVVRLHENTFLITSASVGTYGRDQATLWVTGSPARILSGLLITRMEEKISNVSTPFTPVAERKHDDRPVYELIGLGQQHYYFQSDKLVIWLAVDPEIAPSVLDDVLTYYP
jgi:hypothetical protein